ncbi:hypothetical protein [Neptunomonas sp. XY-337]|uniref:hypothetical protein n=1 Tax=Neptunomonas sp. XY-337 TaxID=2561897 RepID=UPI0010AB3B4F|nr:hypothetical protein [Neptunomonas sp. XY-337]
MQHTENGLTQYEVDQREQELLSRGYRQVSWNSQLDDGEYAISQYSGDASDFGDNVVFAIKYT